MRLDKSTTDGMNASLMASPTSLEVFVGSSLLVWVVVLTVIPALTVDGLSDPSSPRSTRVLRETTQDRVLTAAEPLGSKNNEFVVHDYYLTLLAWTSRLLVSY